MTVLGSPLHEAAPPVMTVSAGRSPGVGAVIGLTSFLRNAERDARQAGRPAWDGLRTVVVSGPPPEAGRCAEPRPPESARHAKPCACTRRRRRPRTARC